MFMSSLLRCDIVQTEPRWNVAEYGMRKPSNFLQKYN
jgi:hypothetical protein